MKSLSFLFCLIMTITNSLLASNTDTTVEKRTYTYKRVQDLDIELDVYRYKFDKINKPVIVWIHSGALIFGSKNDIREEQVQFYLNSGFSVVSVNYRLAPETRMQDIVIDLKDAITWIRKNSASINIDANRLFVIGHSAGGYLALMTGYILDTPPQAIVSFYGYGDILGSWYNQPDSFYCTKPLVKKEEALKRIQSRPLTHASYADRFDFYLYCRQNGIWTNTVSGIDPFRNPDSLIYYCPIRNIHSKYPPVLFIHGDHDTDVPYFQSTLMQKELTKHGIENKLITMPGYGHVFDSYNEGLKNEKIFSAFQTVVMFLQKH